MIGEAIVFGNGFLETFQDSLIYVEGNKQFGVTEITLDDVFVVGFGGEPNQPAVPSTRSFEVIPYKCGLQYPYGKMEIRNFWTDETSVAAPRLTFVFWENWSGHVRWGGEGHSCGQLQSVKLEDGRTIEFTRNTAVDSKVGIATSKPFSPLPK